MRAPHLHASEDEEEDDQEGKRSESESDYDSDSSEAAVRPTKLSWLGAGRVPGGGLNAPRVCDIRDVALDGKLGREVNHQLERTTEAEAEVQRQRQR